MSLKANLFKVPYRLTFPGGLLLAMAVAWLRAGAWLHVDMLPEPDSAVGRFFPLAVFLAGVVLCAVFRRSRLFFALLALTLAHASLTWIAPHLSAATAQVLMNALTSLVPLNLMVLAFLQERGIISPSGRRRLAIIGVEAVAVTLVCLPQLAQAAKWLNHPFVPERFSAWSHLSQPALVSFALAMGVMIVSLVQRYRAVESGLLWALIASFAAFWMGGAGIRPGIFFATSGLVLIVALLETSYKMAYHDELTQLPSRRALNEALMKLPESYTIAMVDVDHFKKFNDTYGHEAGDQALRLVASRLAYVAGGGKAYRYGGEEFAVLFPGKPAEEVFVYLDRMRRLIEQSSFVVRGKERRKGKNGKGRAAKMVKKETNVTVSVGVAASNGDRLAPAEVLRFADQALYRAKAKGRNCTVTAKFGKGTAKVQPSMSAISVS